MARRKLSEHAKVSLFRWWFVGALYFFLALGTGWGNSLSALDLVFFLSIGIGLATAFIFNPIIYGMFDLRRDGKSLNQAYYAQPVWKRVLQKLREIGKCTVVVVLVYITYQLINIALISARSLPPETVVLKGEPFLFTTLFLLYYNLISTLVHKAIAAVASAGSIQNKVGK
jgi:hypothetical protein